MMAMEFCGREYNFPTHFGEVADTCGDLNIACPSCLLAHIAKLEARIAQLEAQRGGAVVVPAWNRSDFDKVPPEWPEMQCFGAGYELATSRIQPILADRVLADGMVGVDREEWDALNQIASSVTLPPNGCARILDVDWAEAANGRRNLDALRSAKGEVEG